MIQKLLWIEDQVEDLYDYVYPLSQYGFHTDTATTVTEAIEKLCNNQYCAVIFDLKIHAGENIQWIALEKQKLLERPNHDPLLGIELLNSILHPSDASIKFAIPIFLDPKIVVVFTVVQDESIRKKIINFGVPENQIKVKQAGDFGILKSLVCNIVKTND